MKISLLILCLLSGLLRLGAQNIQIHLLKDVGNYYPVDTINVYTETSEHEPLPALKRNAFQLWLKQEQVQPLMVEHLINVSPARILFCLDISGTMAGLPFDNARSSIEKWLVNLPTNVETGLCTIGNDFRIIQPFTRDRNNMRRRLQALTASDQQTELFYSVFKALEIFEKSANKEMRFLVLFSDGKNEGSAAYNIDDCVKKAQQDHVIIHSVGLHRIDGRYLKNLEKLSDLSGGVFIQPATVADIQKAYQQIYRYLFSSYLLRFDLSDVPGGIVAPLRLQIKSRYGSGQLVSRRLTAIPSGFPYSYLLILGLIIGLSLSGVYWIRRKNKRAMAELQSEIVGEISHYEGQIKGYKENLSKLAMELSEQLSLEELSQENAPSAKELSTATRVLDPRIAPTAFLQFESACAQENLIEIKNFPVRIGKKGDCEIRLNDPTVSRLHAIISKEEDQFFVTDQNSTNGIRVNGQKVQRLAIKDNDELRFGKCRCRFRIV